MYLSEPLEFTGEALKIKIEEAKEIDFLRRNKDFLRQQFKNLFGKEIDFEFVAKEEEEAPKSKFFTQNFETEDSSDEKNPFVKKLIDELGAREIK